MQIANVRFGHATNSSSSHSLVFLPNGVMAQDFDGDRENLTSGFGQERFTLASKESKLRYLSVMLRDRLMQSLPENIANLIMKDWLGLELEFESYIDHQSLYHLPCTFNSNIPDQQFIEHFWNYLSHENLVILGGNDNESCRHPLDDGQTFLIPIPMDVSFSKKFVCRYDDKYDYWTIYNPENGTRVRFRLTPGSKDFAVIPKASAPELVDVKITDYCTAGCSYCYQGSSVEGKIADSYSLWRIIEVLSSLKVFEVAIGGGEPVAYPRFDKILKNFKDAGITANFTTRDISWLRDPRVWPNIMESCGSFGYSAKSESEIRELKVLLDYNGIPTSRAVIHIVLGTHNEWTFSRLINCADDCGFSILLLGFKNTGRAVNYSMQNYDWWLKVIETARDNGKCPRISIDTSLAQDYHEGIINADVPEWMLESRDGGFSCYIDAVRKKISASSYCREDEYHDLDSDGVSWEERLPQVFSNF